jgi:hypothetical protein
MVGAAGIEPATLGLEISCSIYIELDEGVPRHFCAKWNVRLVNYVAVDTPDYSPANL